MKIKLIKLVENADFSNFKQNAVIASSTLILAGTASSANADLPTAVTAAFTALKSNFTDMEAAAWPIVTAVVGGFVLISLFKKFAYRSV